MSDDPRPYQDAASGLESFLACIRMPESHNTVFGSEDPDRQMTNAAMRDSSVGGCANASERRNGSTPPSDRWRAFMPKGADIKQLQDDPGRTVKDGIQTLKKLGKIPKGGLTVATGMHLIPRYDKKPGIELARSKSKNETKCLGRYMTAQCVDDGIRTSLGAVRPRMPDSVPESLRTLLESVRSAGVRIRPALPGREFFTTDAMALLKRHKTPFLMPCRNTYNVVAALRESAQERRNSTSGNAMEWCSKVCRLRHGDYQKEKDKKP